ncbi:MAG: TetR family transcriptional regulator [Pseudomonadales bacterium]|nr:TetR family transcriptional regulator [Pseudomonadales bacterium]
MAKPGLNRQAYIDVAFDLIVESGVEKLSMRKVAGVLNVSAMAMYKHFPNKDALLAATLDEVIKRADVYPDDELDWPQWIEHVARGMYTALCEQSSWVPLLGSLQLGSQAITVTQSFVIKLNSAGFSIEQSLQAYFAVIQLVIGAACLNTSIKHHQHNLQETQIPEALEKLISTDQLEMGLPFLMQSLKAQLKNGAQN